jgi:hypothetical protein
MSAFRWRGARPRGFRKGSLTEQGRIPIAAMTGCLLLAVRVAVLKLPRADPGDLLGKVPPVVTIKHAHPIIEKCLDALGVDARNEQVVKVGRDRNGAFFVRGVN